MAKITLFSQHIPIDKITNSGALLRDIVLFNDAVHTACAIKTKMAREGKSERITDEKGATVDRRLKENKGLLESASPSVHMQIKARFNVDDHFANSAVREASAAVKSQRELASDYIDQKKDVRSAVKKKRDKDKKRLKALVRLKKSMIERSRARKAGLEVPYPKMPQGGLLWYDKKHDVFCLRTLSKKNGGGTKRDVIYAYKDDYNFELFYLDPEIRWLKHEVKLLEMRYNRLGREINTLKTEVRGICFGTKKLFKARETVYTNKDEWRNAWDRKRHKGMTLSGRADACQGNFLVDYDTQKQMLTYKSTDGTNVKMRVCFPHGQKLVDRAVSLGRRERNAVAWRFERTRGTILVKCIISTFSDRVNDCFDTGCVAFDTNADNIAFAELDGSGNVLYHKTISFNLEGKSSGHREMILSRALEKVFVYASQVHKPVAGEDLSITLRGMTYGFEQRNRVLTTFAFRRVQELAESKAVKHELLYKKVSPSYTSQIGKVKFAKKHGITVHESAAVAIGRRAIGIEEKVPPCLKHRLTEKELSLPRRKQWKALYSFTKDVTLSQVYRETFGGKSA